MAEGIKAGEATRGILNPIAGFRRFDLQRTAPDADLAPLVDWIWIIRWNLEAPFEQQVLPHPCVNLSFEARGSAVHGMGTERSVAHLRGQGRVVAAKFKPGGFFGFTSIPMRELLDRVVPVAEAFGAEGARVEGRLLGDEDDAAAARVLQDFLRTRKPECDPVGLEVMALAARAQTDRDVRCAKDLAKIAGASVRSLHRSFERYVGVGPKWIIRRSRVQEAAERVAAGAIVPWSALAQELGYHDQAHLIRDFKAQIGFTPAVYADRCAKAAQD
jgi:AraC-like DNA-binding protein